ncbi:hypothetical protein AXF42_Ash016742 [Apostasia shenzhenica]|uniref:Uncharacterized protein n=1 Tax=Apostasia shenzhenica TaxID=1088818 RepID=A0A2I0AQE3_9ASPA|nr:hypothetical protein AXF42_Ash016742 [Apostasia shenzhenica]
MEYYSTRRLLNLVVAAAVVCGTGQMTTTTAEGQWTRLEGPAANVIAELAANLYNHLEPGQLTYLFALGAQSCFRQPAVTIGDIYDISFSADLHEYRALPHGRMVKTMMILVIARMRILFPYNPNGRAIILAIANFVYVDGFPLNENRHN